MQVPDLQAAEADCVTRGGAPVADAAAAWRPPGESAVTDVRHLHRGCGSCSPSCPSPPHPSPKTPFVEIHTERDF